MKGVKCLRTIYRKITKPELDLLKRKYDYIYLAIYKRINDDNFYLLEKKTPVIKLTRPLNNIYRSFNNTTRIEINRTKKNEDLSFVCNDKNLDEAWMMNANFEKSKGWTPIRKDELKHSKIFSAYYQDKMIALITTFCNDGVIRVGQISSVRILGHELEFPTKYTSFCTRRIVYEMCKYGIDKGFELLDLGVVNLTDPAKAGISRFKMSFKGEIVDTFIYRYETEKFKSLKKEFIKSGDYYIH